MRPQLQPNSWYRTPTRKNTTQIEKSVSLWRIIFVSCFSLKTTEDLEYDKTALRGEGSRRCSCRRTELSNPSLAEKGGIDPRIFELSSFDFQNTDLRRSSYNLQETIPDNHSQTAT
jgi:hypothetical protein